MVAKATQQRSTATATPAQSSANHVQASSTSRPKRKPRKRRRRGIMSDSDSDSDSSDSSSEEEENGDAVRKIVTVSEPMVVDSVPALAAATSSSSASSPSSSASSSSESSSESSSSESDSSSDSSSDEDEDETPNRPPQPTAAVHHRPYAMSPTPPPISLPSFLPIKKAATTDDAGHQNGEEERRAKFRKIWMSKVVEAFEPDLEQIRQNEPALTATRLGTLIDSLAAGIDIFNDHTQPSSRPDEVDEVGFIVGTCTE